MLEGFRIKTIVTVGTLLLSASLVLTTASHIMGARLGIRDMVYTSDNMLPSVAVLGKTTVHFELVRLRLARTIMAENPRQQAIAVNAFKAAIVQVDRDLADFAPLISDKRDADLYQLALHQWRNFKPAVEQVSQLSLQGHRIEANDLFQTRIVHDAETMQRTLDAATDYNVEEAQRYTANTVIEARGAIYQSAILGVAGLLIGLFILSLFRRRVTRPLISLEKAMGAMAEGQLDITIPGAEKRDELGKIARALDGIKHSITHRAVAEADGQIAVQRRVTGSLEIALTALKEGKLDHRIREAFPSEYEQLRGDFNAMTEALEGQLEEVALSSDAVRGGAGEISAAAGDEVDGSRSRHLNVMMRLPSGKPTQGAIRHGN
ncbi:methyl-accepting chemotaxis protein [Novosphingobium terrae]|uniref:methyl-accepting chemotaxis protein n=1 Tax=Novosphingobium terrae TaxID=2726189 RepID=UPI00197CBA18|nr:methyl-accepting chemotaxis protein [Novosphingobium terrae]